MNFSNIAYYVSEYRGALYQAGFGAAEIGAALIAGSNGGDDIKTIALIPAFLGNFNFSFGIVKPIVYLVDKARRNDPKAFSPLEAEIIRFTYNSIKENSPSPKPSDC